MLDPAAPVTVPEQSVNPHPSTIVPTPALKLLIDEVVAEKVPPITILPDDDVPPDRVIPDTLPIPPTHVTVPVHVVNPQLSTIVPTPLLKLVIEDVVVENVPPKVKQASPEE